jgi:hypothetical protein
MAGADSDCSLVLRGLFGFRGLSADFTARALNPRVHIVSYVLL